jgi:hypothetical protein
MGTFRHRSVRWLALTAAAAAAASGLSVLGGVAVRVAAASDFVFVSGNPIPGDGTALEGNSVGGIVGQFFDTGAAAPSECGNQSQFTVTVDWGDKTTPDTKAVVGCASGTLPGTDTNAPEYSVVDSHTYADSGTYDITITVTDTKDSMSDSKKTDTATISDQKLFTETDTNQSCARTNSDVSRSLVIALTHCTGTEGSGLTINTFFSDNNESFPDGAYFDPGITATIDWGDGSAPQSVTPDIPSIDCNCSFGDFEVTATHVYDAAANDYTITVTAKDDGGKMATDTLTASISDVALTAGSNKSLTATAGMISSSTVGSFSDAAGAQASAGDFAAMIDWGDGSTMVGTVKQTSAGNFDVTGAHGYSTTGTKSITTVVTDQEGQSVTLKATTTVNAAPAPVAAALPTTGQPQQPSPLPLALLILGAMAILGAGGTLLFRRTTR